MWKAQERESGNRRNQNKRSRIQDWYGAIFLNIFITSEVSNISFTLRRRRNTRKQERIRVRMSESELVKCKRVLAVTRTWRRRWFTDLPLRWRCSRRVRPFLVRYRCGVSCHAETRVDARTSERDGREGEERKSRTRCVRVAAHSTTRRDLASSREYVLSERRVRQTRRRGATWRVTQHGDATRRRTEQRFCTLLLQARWVNSLFLSLSVLLFPFLL